MMMGQRDNDQSSAHSKLSTCLKIVWQMCLFTVGLLGKIVSMYVAYFKALFRYLLRKAAISTVRMGSLRPESQTQNHPNKS